MLLARDTYLFSFDDTSKTYSVFVNIRNDRDWNQELDLCFNFDMFSYGK